MEGKGQWLIFQKRGEESLMFVSVPLSFSCDCFIVCNIKEHFRKTNPSMESFFLGLTKVLQLPLLSHFSRFRENAKSVKCRYWVSSGSFSMHRKLSPILAFALWHPCSLALVFHCFCTCNDMHAQSTDSKYSCHDVYSSSLSVIN